MGFGVVVTGHAAADQILDNPYLQTRKHMVAADYDLFCLLLYLRSQAGD